MSFGGSRSATETTQNQTTEQVGGGDVGSSVIGTGGSDISISNTTTQTSDEAFDFASGLADSVFDFGASVSAQSRQVQLAGLGAADVAIAGTEKSLLQNKNLMIAGAAVVAIVLFMRKK